MMWVTRPYKPRALLRILLVCLLLPLIIVILPKQRNRGNCYVVSCKAFASPHIPELVSIPATAPGFSLKHVVLGKSRVFDIYGCVLVGCFSTLSSVRSKEPTSYLHRRNPYYFFAIDPFLDVWVSRSLIENGGTWEEPLNDLFLDLLSKSDNSTCDIVMDVGSNLGAFALFAGAQGCTVWAFEMQPFVFTLLELSTRVNGYRDRFRLFNHPVWDATNMPVSFKTYEGNFGGTEAHSNPKPGDAVAYTIQIKDVFDMDSDIFFLKLDVEKAEFHALRGLGSVFTQRRVKHFVVELRRSHEEMVNWFYDIGYRCSLYNRKMSWTRLEILAIVESIADGAYNDIYCTVA